MLENTMAGEQSQEVDIHAYYQNHQDELPYIQANNLPLRPCQHQIKLLPKTLLIFIQK